MRTINLLAVLVFSIFSFNFSFAQNASFKTEDIKVWGNCSMCKKNIQSAAKNGGATSAIWSAKTQIMKVNYSTAVTTRKKIQQAIAKAGYDTEDVTAGQEAYDKLHACCQYERKATATTDVTIKKSCCNHHDAADAKGKACCSKHTAGTDKHCCEADGCKHDAVACKEAACCKDKDCCKL